jgi:hypothetical protein
MQTHLPWFSLPAVIESVAHESLIISSTPFIRVRPAIVIVPPTIQNDRIPHDSISDETNQFHLAYARLITTTRLHCCQTEKLSCLSGEDSNSSRLPIFTLKGCLTVMCKAIEFISMSALRSVSEASLIASILRLLYILSHPVLFPRRS